MNKRDYYHYYRDEYKNEFNKFLDRDYNVGMLEPDPFAEVPYIDYKNYVFAGSDNSKAWEKNLEEHRDKLEYYIDNPINYRFNKQWFRSDFDYKPEPDRKVDIYLGCSHTMGVGKHLEHTWVQRVGEHTGNDIINLGTGGHGIDVSYIVLKKYINYYNVQNVFHYQPIYPRHYILDVDERHQSISPAWSLNIDKYFTKEYQRESLMDWGYIMFTYARAIDAIESVCKKRNIKYYFNELENIKTQVWMYFNTGREKIKEGDVLARDLMHYSFYSHKEIADWFIDKALKYNYFYNWRGEYKF